VRDRDLGRHEGHLPGRHPRVESVGVEADLAGLAGLEVDGLRGEHGAVDGKRYFHAAPRGCALEADRGQEHGRALQVGDPVLEAEVGHPGVLRLLRGQLDDLQRGAELGKRLVERLRRPVARLLIGQEHDLFVGRAGGAAAGLFGQVQGRSGRGRPVHGLDRRQGLQGVLLGAIGPEAELARRGADRDHRHAAPGGHPVDEFLGPASGLVEHGPPELLVAHTQAVVHQQDNVDRLARVHGLAGTHEVRPGHGQAEEQDAQHAHGQQDQVLQPDHAAAAAHRLAQELHGRPLDHAEPLPVQQVDEDRAGGEGQTGCGKPGGTQHGDSNRWRQNEKWTMKNEQRRMRRPRPALLLYHFPFFIVHCSFSIIFPPSWLRTWCGGCRSCPPAGSAGNGWGWPAQSTPRR